MALRSALITTALRVVGDSTLTTEAGEWFDMVFDDIDANIYLRHLQKVSTQATADSDDDYALPSDYLKGLMVTSANSPYELTFVSPEEMEVLRRLGDTGNPEKWTIEASLIVVYPKPVTGSLPTLTFSYYTAITRPLVTEDVTTLSGLKRNWDKVIIQGLIAYGYQFTDDVRAETQMQRYNLLMASQNIRSPQTTNSGGAKPGFQRAFKSVGGMPRR